MSRTGAHDRSPARHGRRRARLLGRGAQGLPEDPGTALLGPQDGERAEKLPKGVQPKAKAMLHDIWMAETKAAAEQAFDLFLATFAAKFPAATTCLTKDRDVLLTFYDFPAEHWIHIRTTNPVESTFATVRLRTTKTKGSGSRLACLTMVFKLALAAQKTWRALNASQLITDVIDGVPFVDGIRKKAA